jgi:hypothetical protein
MAHFKLLEGMDPDECEQAHKAILIGLEANIGYMRRREAAPALFSKQTETR